MSGLKHIFIIALMFWAAVVAEEDVEGVDSEGRTFGHLAKPLKKFTNKLGQYLVYASSDYPYQYQTPIVHHNYGGYYGGYNGAGYHRPGFFGGFRDIEK